MSRAKTDDNLLTLVKSAVDAYAMLNRGDRVFTALSGGADSISMLLCLRELDMDLDMTAIHVNHGLRGEESDRDERFCRDFCARIGIPLECRRVDAKAFSKANGMTLEEGARAVRYRIFSDIAGTHKTATAHTMSDNAETVLINMVRGSGLKGLCGIPAVRGNIIRPLIYASRADVLGYLSGKDQNFVTDSSNLFDEYTRNRLRHKVMPVLSELNPSLEKTLANMKTALEADEAYLEAEAKTAYKCCILPNGDGFSAALAEYPYPLRARCFAMLFKSRGLPISFERLSAADGLLFSGGAVTLSTQLRLVSDKYGLRLVYEKGVCALPATLLIPEKPIYYGGKSLYARVEPIEILDIEKKIHINLSYLAMDYDKIKGQVFIRSRLDGDRITLHHRKHSSSVKKLLNASVPLEERSRLFFAEDSDGLIFVEKIGIADRVGIDENTRRILMFFVDFSDERQGYG